MGVQGLDQDRYVLLDQTITSGCQTQSIGTDLDASYKLRIRFVTCDFVSGHTRLAQ